MEQYSVTVSDAELDAPLTQEEVSAFVASPEFGKLEEWFKPPLPEITLKMFNDCVLDAFRTISYAVENSFFVLTKCTETALGVISAWLCLSKRFPVATWARLVSANRTKGLTSILPELTIPYPILITSAAFVDYLTVNVSLLHRHFPLPFTINNVSSVLLEGRMPLSLVMASTLSQDFSSALSDIYIPCTRPFTTAPEKVTYTDIATMVRQLRSLASKSQTVFDLYTTYVLFKHTSASNAARVYSAFKVAIDFILKNRTTTPNWQKAFVYVTSLSIAAKIMQPSDIAKIVAPHENGVASALLRAVYSKYT